MCYAFTIRWAIPFKLSDDNQFQETKMKFAKIKTRSSYYTIFIEMRQTYTHTPRHVIAIARPKIACVFCFGIRMEMNALFLCDAWRWRTWMNEWKCDQISSANTVPDKCNMTISMRYLPGHALHKIYGIILFDLCMWCVRQTSPHKHPPTWHINSMIKRRLENCLSISLNCSPLNWWKKDAWTIAIMVSRISLKEVTWYLI